MTLRIGRAATAGGVRRALMALCDDAEIEVSVTDSRGVSAEPADFWAGASCGAARIAITLDAAFEREPRPAPGGNAFEEAWDESEATGRCPVGELAGCLLARGCVPYSCGAWGTPSCPAARGRGEVV